MQVSRSSNAFYKLLVTRYKNNQATDDELLVFFQLIQEGVLEAYLQAEMDRDIQLQETKSTQNKVIPGWLRMGSAAALAALISGLMIWLMPTKGTQQDSLIIRYSDTSQRFIRFSDGSSALLNEGSEISYPATFADTREVTLCGEGYFEVVPEAAHHFIVNTGKIRITVLGTAFNVKSMPGQQNVSVVVERGKVKVQDGERHLATVLPDQQVTVNTVTNEIETMFILSGEVTAWKKRYLIFDNAPLKEVCARIAEKYKVDIVLQNKNLESCSITGTLLDTESLERVLKIISTVVNGTFQKKANGSYLISGTGCTP